ncbi:Crp/Fnr family transcriptional regulator [Solitalea canadensis]|uniref:cAMP-binding protein n=1 Tax=Solitalea canadensis (strain ATCC 29591 / DSM 3403 / JCM 21819 / LMG 8368 / NBRC 15130 / NCIMB 12057 / USAM 9D) TaxID=929556 RepID=H8KL02_SOLCM|nr:Crp/Fnr family transcriptional regulator [Solitalea canadensis]AFD08819.1 cAMP-binding protein [Solitalea canadensis DSM 3403]
MTNLASSTLLNHINRYVKLSEKEENLLLSLLKHQSLKKKAYLLTEGQICKANYFVAKGCLRNYLINDKGVKQITQFAIENWWITDYNSMVTQTPSGFFIQALENSEVIAIDYHVQEELFEKIPKLERYFRLVLERAYSASQMRIKFIFTQTGEERYHHFATSFPGFIQRVPQYMLASYLGFTPEFLSKIRAK